MWRNTGLLQAMAGCGRCTRVYLPSEESSQAGDWNVSFVLRAHLNVPVNLATSSVLHPDVCSHPPVYFLLLPAQMKHVLTHQFMRIPSWLSAQMPPFLKQPGLSGEIADVLPRTDERIEGVSSFDEEKRSTQRCL